jgi:protein MBA1
LFTSPLAALSLQWTRLKRKTSDLLVVSIYRWTNHKCGVKIHFRQTAPTAKALHQAMYTAFAAGDLATLKRITADGLFDSFSARVHARPRGERWVWELVRYTRRPRVMSNRAASLMVDDAGIRQAVVRICSRQRLTRYKADGSVVKGSGEEREVKEYVVIQRKLWKGKEGEWVVWGTTEETTQEMVEEAKKKALQ